MKWLFAAAVIGIILVPGFNVPSEAQKSCPYQLGALKSRVSEIWGALEGALGQNRLEEACRISSGLVAAQGDIVRHMKDYQVGCEFDSNEIEYAERRRVSYATMADEMVAKMCTKPR